MSVHHFPATKKPSRLELLLDLFDEGSEWFDHHEPLPASDPTWDLARRALAGLCWVVTGVIVGAHMLGVM